MYLQLAENTGDALTSKNSSTWRPYARRLPLTSRIFLKAEGAFARPRKILNSGVGRPIRRKQNA